MPTYQVERASRLDSPVEYLTTPRLGRPIEIQEEFDAAGEFVGYRAVYPCLGPSFPSAVMRWRIEGDRWRPHRVPFRELIAYRYPHVPALVAQAVQGRDEVMIAELRGNAHPNGYLARTIGIALQSLGFRVIQRLNATGQRPRIYIRDRAT